ncbi:hypothetical protein ACFL9T_03050 [Thermodesulfobacteriota bacterium]
MQNLSWMDEKAMILFSIIGLFIVAAVFLFIIIEYTLRIRKWIRNVFFIKEVKRKDFLAAEYQDYINWIEDWSKPMFQYLPIGFRLFNNHNQIASINNNSLGFRCEEFEEPDENTLRLIILGGSSAWGCGASSNEKTIAGQLERMINSDSRALGSFRRAKCYNLAQVNGYQTQDLLTMLFFTRKIRPHYAVSFTGWNELVAINEMKIDLLEKYGVYYISEMEGWEPIGVGDNKKKLLKKALKMWGIEKSEVVKFFSSFNNPQETEGGSTLKEKIALGTKIFIDHLKKIQILSQALNMKHYQFMQPYLFRKKFLTEQEAKVIHLYDDVRPVMGGKQVSDYLRENNIYIPILSECRRNPEIGPLIDLCDIFREEHDSMFYTLVHLTDQGYRKIAENIFEALPKY